MIINNYFDYLLLNNFNIIEIDVKNMSIYSLCYALYGDLEFKEKTLELNRDRIINPRLINGKFLIIRKIN